MGVCRVAVLRPADDVGNQKALVFEPKVSRLPYMSSFLRRPPDKRLARGCDSCCWIDVSCAGEGNPGGPEATGRRAKAASSFLAKRMGSVTPP